jgi:hypothetical protein
MLLLPSDPTVFGECVCHVTFALSGASKRANRRLRASDLEGAIRRLHGFRFSKAVINSCDGVWFSVAPHFQWAAAR